MARLPKEIADFMEKYGVTADEIWLVAGGKNYAIKHKALERIAADNGIKFDRPSVIEANAADKIAVVCVFGTMGDRTEWSFGEAAPYNYRTTEKMAAYPYAMAEKRAKDRVVLKLLNTDGTLYSEDEADDFKQPRENPHVTRPEDISDGKPNGEIPHIDGVTAQPKAKSRETYAELEAEMFRLQTLPGLMAWGKTIAATVATMHPDFQDTFRRRFAEYRDELKAMAEAAE
jgi:hypothetical protein